MRSRMPVMSLFSISFPGPSHSCRSFEGPIMAPRTGFRLSCPALFNKPSAMPFLRACLISTVLVSLAAAQTLPQGLTRQGDVVMMQPIPDGSSEAGALPGSRPSRLRYPVRPPITTCSSALSRPADRGDWTGARSLAAQGQDPVARQLLEWRYALDKNSGATFAEIDAVIKNTSPGPAPAPGRCAARSRPAPKPPSRPTWRPPRSSPGSATRRPTLPSAGSGWVKHWWRRAKRPKAPP